MLHSYWMVRNPVLVSGLLAPAVYIPRHLADHNQPA